MNGGGNRPMFSGPVRGDPSVSNIPRLQLPALGLRQALIERRQTHGNIGCFFRDKV
jgi:hypothetical protein